MNKSINPVPALFSSAHLAHWQAKNKSPVEPVTLADESVFELMKYARQSTDNSFREVPRDSFKATLESVEEIREKLSVSGSVIVDRIPIISTEIGVYRRAAGILSNLIAPLMAQDIKGTLLYDVLDEGTPGKGTVRRSKTNESQPFHTDGPWHSVTPSIIGLFCIKPADEGGYSQVSSLQHSINELTDNNPKAVTTLQQDHAWNRMGQFTDSENPYSELPVIEEIDGKTLIRHYVDYVKTGHDLAGTTATTESLNLLDELEASLARNACEPFKLEAGQMQFVNNWTVAHARAGFDDANRSTGRHLLRLWNS